MSITYPDGMTASQYYAENPGFLPGPTVDYSGGNTSGSGLPTLPSLPNLTGGNMTTGLNAFLQGVLHPFDTVTGNYDPNATAGDIIAGKGSSLGQSINATGSALGFITNIPRVVTTVLGLILIIAGIFSLSKGPAVNIVTSAVKNAATS